jgi:F-type H+-transporting ATPase subunit b
MYMRDISQFDLYREQRFVLTRSETAVQEPAATKSTNPFAPEEMAGYTVNAIITVINLLVAYFILKRFLFKPILALLEKRRESVENDLKDAEDKAAQAAARLSEAEKTVQQARTDAADILSESREQAQKQSMMIISSAKEEAEGTRQKAETDAQRIHRSTVEKMRDEVADLALSIAQKVIGEEISEARKDEIRHTVSGESQKAGVRSD